MSLGSTQMSAGEIFQLFKRLSLDVLISLVMCYQCFLQKKCAMNVLTVIVAPRFFKQYLLLLAVNQMAAALFRFISGASRNMIVANVSASFMLLVVMVLGGFILQKG